MDLNLVVICGTVQRFARTVGGAWLDIEAEGEAGRFRPRVWIPTGINKEEITASTKIWVVGHLESATVVAEQIKVKEDES